MEDFEALKAIWHGQSALPKVSDEDVLNQVRKTKRQFANKLLFEVITMLLAITVLVFVWVITPFKMWTTHLSMFIFTACCVYYLFSQLKDYRRISNNSLLSKPEKYIGYLKKYRRDRYILNTRKYGIYTTFLSLGFAFYFIEIFFLSSIWITLLVIAFTIIWLWACYYIFMRRQIRKEEASLGEMIENLERLQKQFSRY